ncbi:MAG: archaellum component FlaC [Natronomonas sp.]|jgi:archaellum component FlaC
MSDSEAYEEITVSSDGVTVVKRFEEDEFPVPAIAFEFESAREESVTVRMDDTVPEGIEVEDLGFHPEYGSEFWAIDDDTISFERELEAEEHYTTVYGIRATGSDNVQQFLTEPTIGSVEPPLPGDGEHAGDVVPETNDSVAQAAISDDGEIPGLEADADEEDADDEDVTTLELNDPNNSERRAAEGGDRSAAEGEDATLSVSGESLTAALAAEIRQQNVSGEDLKLLRRALDVAEKEDNSGSDRARIEQLQDDISDLRAYTSALEEFLDENGTGTELIEDFEQQLDSFDQRLESVNSELQSNSEQVSTASENVDRMSETVSTVESEIDSLSEDVDEVNTEMSAVEAEIEGVSSDLEEVDTTVDELDSAVDEIGESVADLEEQLADEDVTQRIDDLEEQIADLQTWQAQIKETFGG